MKSSRKGETEKSWNLPLGWVKHLPEVPTAGAGRSLDWHTKHSAGKGIQQVMAQKPLELMSQSKMSRLFLQVRHSAEMWGTQVDVFGNCGNPVEHP